MNDLVAKYRSINESFSKKLVFRLGIEAGFFSEYNNMILAMAYCLKHRIRFTLYSENAWFSHRGWTEFFEPFCNQETSRHHMLLNHREVPPPPGKRTMVLTAWTKLLHGIDYFTWQLWAEFRNRETEQETFDIPELGIKGKLRDACRVLTDFTWRYNLASQKIIHELIDFVNLPPDYVGFHIRGGDKFKEDKLHPLNAYFDDMASRTDCRNAFVLTDDYRIIETIRKEYPEWKIYTLCQENERGYYHQDFLKKDPEFIREQTLRLFASTDILLKSELFLGTFTSNPGMYLGMRMEAERCLGVNGTTWRLW
jgi:hypothetical protein